MLAVVSAILPIFMLLALGWVLRQRGFPGEGFWPYLDPLVYYVLFPALLIHTFAHVDIKQIAVLPAGAATVGAMLIVTGGVFLVRRHLGVDGPAFSSLLQGVVRFNTYIGFGVAAALHGTAGITLFSVVIAFVIPTANLISIAGLTRYGGAGSAGLRSTVTAVVTNPLILSVLVGVLLSISGIGLPWVLDPFLDILRRGALPLGLLAAGAGLDLAALRDAGRPVLLACGLKLIVLPIVALATTHAFGVDGVTRTAVLIYAVAPVSPAAYILARQLGGDARLMAAIVTVSTFIAVASVPLWLMLAS